MPSVDPPARRSAPSRSRFSVRVVPRAKSPGAAGRRNGQPLLRVSAPPDAGRANGEVERLLTRMLGTKARIVRGQTSRLKLVEVDLDGAELQARLDRVFPH